MRLDEIQVRVGAWLRRHPTTMVCTLGALALILIGTAAGATAQSLADEQTVGESVAESLESIADSLEKIAALVPDRRPAQTSGIPEADALFEALNPKREE